MKVQIPLGFKEDVTNMDQCDILLIATLSLFHNVYGTDAYIELDTRDIRSIIYSKIEDHDVTMQSGTLLREFKEKGWLNYGKGVNGSSVMVQINNEKFGGFRGKFAGCGLLYHDSSISAELTDVRAIMRFCYLLGRMANVTANADVYELRQDLVIPKTKNNYKNVIVVPNVYLDQLTYDDSAPKRNRKMKNEQSI